MKQINFSRQWRRIEPLLNDRDIKLALNFGLFCQNPKYRCGDPPWLEGRGLVNGQRVRTGKLSWYQPWGRCHAIAPFAWAVSKRLYPEWTWAFLTSEWHTVAVGLNVQDEIRMVADILLFKGRTAEQSLALVNGQPASLCFNPGELTGGRRRQNRCGDVGWADRLIDERRSRMPSDGNLSVREINLHDSADGSWQSCFFCPAADPTSAPSTTARPRTTTKTEMPRPNRLTQSQPTKRNSTQ